MPSSLQGLLLEGWRPAHAPPHEAWTGEPPAAATGDGGGHRRRREAWGEDPERVASAPSEVGVEAVRVEAARAEEAERQAEILRLVPEPPDMSSEDEIAALRSSEAAYSLWCSSYEQGHALSERHREARAAWRSQVPTAGSVPLLSWRPSPPSSAT